MKQRKFGRLGWPVSEIGYGMWGMAGWTGSDDVESRASLQRAVDLGCTFFDTALAYGDGRSEALLGRLVRDNRGHRLYTATKVPPRNRAWPSRPEFSLDDCYPPAHIEASLHKSLAAAGLERFDLLQLHTWEDGWLADDRWIRTLEDCRRRGQIGGVGLSLNRWEPENGLRAVATGQIDAVQVIYNVFDQNPEDALFPACRQHGVAVIARVPFDEGTLTGQLTLESRWPAGDWRNTYFGSDNLKASVERAERLRPLVPAGSTMAELALRFILNEAAVATTIPGMRKVRHVESNLAASDAGPLSSDLHGQLRGHRWDRRPTRWSQ